MEIQNNLTSDQYRKATKLILKALEIGLDLNKPCGINVNTLWGNTYFWSEEINFNLFISVSSSKIETCCSCLKCGKEIFGKAIGKNMDYYQKWISSKFGKTAEGYLCFRCLKKQSQETMGI